MDSPRESGKAALPQKESLSSVCVVDPVFARELREGSSDMHLKAQAGCSCLLREHARKDVNRYGQPAKKAARYAKMSGTPNERERSTSASKEPANHWLRNAKMSGTVTSPSRLKSP